jgi:L-iditol 2-dehydrogenase
MESDGKGFLRQLLRRNPFFLEVWMRAIVVEKVGEFHIREMEIAKPGPKEALIRVSVTGLCRTDLKLIRVGHRDLTLPRIPGEEVVGTIEAIGSETSGLSIGQRVFVYPGKSCKTCDMCWADAENLCRSMEIMGFHRHGGFAEYVVAPAQSIIPIPDTISDEEAVFAEPLSCCLNALDLAQLRTGETIGIWGGGPAGSLLARAATAMGAEALIIDPDETRASRAHGVLVPPKRSFDVCIVAVGNTLAYREALVHLNPRGRLVLFSGLPHDSSIFSVDFNELHYQEQTLVGAYGCRFEDGVQAMQAIADHSVPVKDLISHSMSLWDLDAALSLVERRACMKIHLYPLDTV